MAKTKDPRAALARKAAAEYSTDPKRAVTRYSELLQKACEIWPADDEELKAEFLGLLPEYRHPLDPLAEAIIFDGYSMQSGPISLVVTPPYFEALKEALDKDHPAYREALAAFVQAEAERNALLRLHGEQTRKIMEAKGEYIKVKAETGRTDKASRRFAEQMGVSTGKQGRTPEDNAGVIFESYIDLVRWQGLSRLDAIERIHKEAVGGNMERITRVRKLVSHTGKLRQNTIKMKSSFPSLLRDAEKYYVGLVPQERDIQAS